MVIILSRGKRGKSEEQRYRCKNASHDQEQVIDIGDGCRAGIATDLTEQEHAEDDRAERRPKRIDAAGKVEPVAARRRVAKDDREGLGGSLLEREAERDNKV